MPLDWVFLDLVLCPPESQRQNKGALTDLGSLEGKGSVTPCLASCHSTEGRVVLVLSEPALVSLPSSGHCRSSDGFHGLGEGPVQDRMTGATLVSAPTPGMALCSLPASIL